MSRLRAHAPGPLRGRLNVPGDKSISHRALLLGALANGTSTIDGFLPGGDCRATLGCLRALGIRIDMTTPTNVVVEGRGLRGLRKPAGPLDCVRSGTTMRLLTGILAAQSFDTTLVGDEQLLRRPMGRVAEPLRQMGADVETTDGHGPLVIRGRRLHGCHHAVAVASAQIKSAILLAGLFADGETHLTQPTRSRDHTERMMAAMGVSIATDGSTITVCPPSELTALSFAVPGDISSAAFPIVAAALVRGSEVTVERVGINPTRTGLLDVLRAMGASVTIEEAHDEGNEPLGDITIRGSTLSGAEIGGETVVRMIDEFPVLAVAATQAHGTTVVRDAAELRVKETDRIATVVVELRKLGANINALPDGFVVEGPTPLGGGSVDSHGDHRLAMALAVAGLTATGDVVIEGAECMADSFPGFIPLMRTLGAAYD